MTATLRRLFARPGGALLLTIGLLATRPATAQWVAQDTGLPSHWGPGYISVVDANTVWATAIDGEANIGSATNTYIRTTNGGTTWTINTLADAKGLTLTNVSAASATVAWMSCDDNDNGGGRLYYTADGGTTWTRQLSTAFAGPAGYINGVLAFSPTQAVALGDPAPGANFEIYTTTNAGTTWTAATTPTRLNATEFGTAGVIATVPGINPALRSCWMGTSSGRVLRSTDSGVTWAAASTGLTWVTTLAFNDATTGIAVDYSTPTVMIATTTDGGATWTTHVPSGRFLSASLSGVPGQPNTFVCAGYDGSCSCPTNSGTSYSTDGGLTWTVLDMQRHYTVAFLNATTGYSGGFVGLSSGMFRGSLPAAALATATAQPLAGLAVYPNPASDYFTAAVPAVANAAQVQATLYNALGQPVARQQASLPATGRQLSFATTGLAAGLYTLRVQAGEKVASQPVSVR